MTKVEQQDRSAAEFLALAAGEAVLNREKVVAVMVIVAYEPTKAGDPKGPVTLAAWGGTIVAQVELLRTLADTMQREGVDAPAEVRTVN